jgi:hypothetical protein
MCGCSDPPLNECCYEHRPVTPEACLGIELGGAALAPGVILSTVLRRTCLMESETEMSNRSYGPWLAGDTAAGDCSRRRKKGKHSEKV